jgi:hypothetical protein
VRGPLAAEDIEKGKILVGAAGFEPTTCSTQNCRATRLRYTPITGIFDVDTRSGRPQQGFGGRESPGKKLKVRAQGRAPANPREA